MVENLPRPSPSLTPTILDSDPLHRNGLWGSQWALGIAVSFGANFVVSQERVVPVFSKSTRDVGSDWACPGIVSRPAHKDKIGVPG